ncbi:EAL domain-containing protein [Methylobacterium sp. 37f]|uniref:bifunctional diguanylate cyclase/phosphodiesterase n=1 Tax=Methylobacterium sp. 37f TaxID=2817058 RepID=UPI001FFDC2DB|nr:EAL domain-containing protein [Methylobacterium sp. 37f]MCK2057229.1 EAL domain-containing protein [Methylobacterium sp. 37f]
MPPFAASETERLAALRDLRILDTPPEPHFDAVCQTAQALFSVPIAMIAFVDQDRIWPKAACGLRPGDIPRDSALCDHVIGSDDLLVIDDVRRDTRFAESPLVIGTPYIRFYAAAPLVLRPGVRLGTLCLIDTVPRMFTVKHREQLRNLARIVEAHLCLYEAHAAIARTEGAYRRVLESAQDAFISMDAEGVITRWNTVAEELFGWTAKEAVGRFLSETIVPEKLRAAHDLGMRRYLRTGRSAIVGNRQMQVAAIKRDGTEFPIEMAMSADRCDGVVTFNAFLRDVSERKEWETSLQASEARYRLLADNATDMIVWADGEGYRRYVSPACKAMFGYEEAELIGTKVADFIHPDDAAMVFGTIRRVAAGELTRGVVSARHRHRNGSWVWVETALNAAFKSGTSAPDGYVAVVREITERRAIEEEKRQGEARLRASEERLALALENGSDGIWDWSVHDQELWFADSLLGMLGFSPGDIPVSIATWTALIHPADREMAQRQFYNHLKGLTATYECEHRLRRKDGEFAWVLARGRVVHRDQAGRALRVVGTHTDITARKAAEQAIARSARHDALTDLPNRLLFRERLDKVFSEVRAENGGCALLYLDLDRFKSVNDTFGHLAGDTLLIEVARRLTLEVREGDTVVRLGGDEFAILQVEGVNQPASSATLAQRVIEAMAEPFRIEGEQVELGISIGIALAPRDAADADTLIKRADLALYRAKADGRNTRRFYEAAMDEAVEYKRRLEMDLRGALTRGEFEVHYQPIVNATSGGVSSVEALVRWRHPLHGLVSPAAFIPLAEETGLVIPLGEWVLQAACEAASTWPVGVSVAVNVSAMQFRKGGLPEAVMRALTASNLPANRLELEITESVLMQDGPDVIDTLHILRNFGVRTALDDFGTGYSSLSYLRRFPFDKLKIDRAFVQDIDSPSTAAIVSAIVKLGVALGMTITAEGIETEDQLAAVRRHGCNEIQGYFFSKPLTMEDLIQFIGLSALSAAA